MPLQGIASGGHKPTAMWTLIMIVIIRLRRLEMPHWHRVWTNPSYLRPDSITRRDASVTTNLLLTE